MSLNGTAQTFIPYTLNGINTLATPNDISSCVKYSGNTSDTNLDGFDLETTGTLSAQFHAIPDTLSNSESWVMYAISTNGNLSTTGGLITQDLTTGQSMYFTGGVVGAPNFQFTTLGTNGKVVVTDGNRVMSTTISAGQLDYITALTSQAAGVGQANTWTGANDFTTLTSVAALRITSSIANADYSLSVNSFDQLEIRNLTTGNAMTTSGDALAILNINAGGTITTGNIEVAGNSYLIGTGTDQWVQSALSGNYEIKDDVGDTRLALSKTTGLTISTLNVTSVPSAPPSLALGINGSGGVVSFAVPTSGSGTVNTSTTTARFLPYLSTATTLTNSLLNQIDNDSMGFGYTAIPNYPLGSAKNMYINGSIFAGGLNSMVGTFGRDTNTSNPANEITFVAGGAGVLLAQIKSHSGSSPFVDATWTYSNTISAPLGANQGQVLLTANKMTMSADLDVNGDFRKQGGNSGANWFSLRGTDTLNSPYLEFFVANLRRSYIGYATTTSMNVFTENGANLQLGTEGLTRMSINTAGNISIVGDFTMTITKPLHLYYISTTNHAGFLCEASGDMVFFTGTGGVGVRLRIASGGDITASNPITAPSFVVNGGGAFVPGVIYSDVNHGMLFRARVPGAANIFLWNNSVGTEVLKMLSAGNMRHQTGDNSYMIYGPNATWNANLVVGASSDKANGNTGQLIVTNGNMHCDAANNFAIYYGFYANQRGTPNPHYFFGGNYEFNGTPQNFSAYAHVCVFAGEQMRRSQCMMRQIYREESIAWTGGVNMTYAFYKYNAQCPVKISGKYSMYSTYVGIQNVGLRIYSRLSGAYFYYNFRTYQNITIAQTTYPFELILTVGDLGAFSTDWFDIYIYGVAGQCQSDANNQLHVCVEVLPVSDF